MLRERVLTGLTIKKWKSGYRVQRWFSGKRGLRGFKTPMFW